MTPLTHAERILQGLGITDPKDIDLEAIRAKYRQERDKRLRPDGELQYLSTSGKFARYGFVFDFGIEINR